MGVHGDDPRGQPSLEGVHGVQGDDGIHRAPLALRTGPGGVSSGGGGSWEQR